jgi:acetyl/propionyl-CoA carboxylase alpha subunit
MGSKIGAKTIMQAHGVPTIPGYQGEDQSESIIRAKALEIGFPVLLKASAGGGGKGMRIVRQESELDPATWSSRFLATSMAMPFTCSKENVPYKDAIRKLLRKAPLLLSPLK